MWSVLVSGACCLPNGNCTVISVQECITSGGDFQGVDVSCGDVVCEVTAGPCCFVEMCIEITEEQCAGISGVFQGVGVSCDDVDCGPPCPWDLDGSGSVGTSDLLDLLAVWGTNPGGPPDFDGDGTVGTSDLLALLAEWGPCP